MGFLLNFEVNNANATVSVAVHAGRITFTHAKMKARSLIIVRSPRDSNTRVISQKKQGDLGDTYI